MFGVYKGDFMQEPSTETLADLDATFLAFLKKYNLEAMKIILQISNELQGYGYLNEVSALYGLIWNKPKFMFGYLLTAIENEIQILLDIVPAVLAMEIRKTLYEYKFYIFR